jgi:hypothetical protein
MEDFQREFLAAIAASLADHGEVVIGLDPASGLDQAAIIDLHRTIIEGAGPEYVLVRHDVLDRIDELHAMHLAPPPSRYRDYLKHDPTKSHRRRRNRR